MLIDISQELFSCKTYPGDPAPRQKQLQSLEAGDVCNLTQFSMCAHNGTHVDAPYHFLDGEETIDRVPLDKFIGYAYVAEHDGDITAEVAERILKDAKKLSANYKQSLIKDRPAITKSRMWLKRLVRK
jgi:arylformamidase